jgi:hypothetical protein
MHHKDCSSEISLAEGEGGLIYNLHNNQVKSLKIYFNNNKKK